MGNIVVNGQTVDLLKTLRGRLIDDPHSGMGSLPLWMPDGSMVKSVSQVGVLLGVDTETAALAVLQSKNAPVSLRTEAKDIHAMSGAHNVRVGLGNVLARAETVTRGKRRRRKKKREKKGLYPPKHSDYSNSICVMLAIEPAKHYAIPGGTPPEELHVTVAWYGEIDPKDKRTANEWIDGARKIADKHTQFIAQVNGITRFSMADYDGSDRDPVVVNIDAKEIEDIRQDVLKEFGPHKSDHGYTPHMTLGYIDKDDPMPINRYEPQPILITGIIVSHGHVNETIEFRKMGE